MDAGGVGVQVACRLAAACGVWGIVVASITGGEVWGAYGRIEDIAEHRIRDTLGAGRGVDGES